MVNEKQQIMMFSFGLTSKNKLNKGALEKWPYAAGAAWANYIKLKYRLINQDVLTIFL